jgi:hypothetical protein
MTVRIRELDNRNALYKVMRYQAICSLPQFFEIREWCWSHWGPGIEYEHYKNYAMSTNKLMPWAWDCSKFQGASLSNAKIYLPDDDKKKALFVLTWG